MLRFVKGTLLSALVLALGLDSTGCGGETAKPKQDEEAVRKGMEKMGKKQKEMAEKYGKPSGTAEEADKDKADANKDKDKEKKEKDKE
jgi:hypothetical protein